MTSDERAELLFEFDRLVDKYGSVDLIPESDSTLLKIRASFNSPEDDTSFNKVTRNGLVPLPSANFKYGDCPAGKLAQSRGFHNWKDAGKQMVDFLDVGYTYNEICDLYKIPYATVVRWVFKVRKLMENGELSYE